MDEKEERPIPNITWWCIYCEKKVYIPYPIHKEIREINDDDKICPYCKNKARWNDK